MLVMIKLKLQNTRSEDAFYLLRNISLEDCHSIEKVSFLKHRLHEIMKELFWTWTKIIRANSKENKVIYAANFYAEEHFHEEDFSVKKAASYVGMTATILSASTKRYRPGDLGLCDQPAHPQGYGTACHDGRYHRKYRKGNRI